MGSWQPGTGAELSYSSAALDSPVGPLAVAVTPAGLLALSFGGLDRLEDTVGQLGLVRRDLGEYVERARAEIADYFAGRRRAFSLPVDWRLSGGFAGRVRRELATTVGYGQTISYSGLAARLAPDGGTTYEAARAVGRAMATNPVAIVVPCHRVVASGGGLHGFGGGLEAKRRLLALEGARPQTLDDLLALG